MSFTISQTPFRISFLGNSDYREDIDNYPCVKLSAAIDKYCYLAVRRLPQFFDYKSRIVYSNIELVHDNNHIEHLAINACLSYLQIRDGVEVCHFSDLPSKSGVGSSSAFVVGLLNALTTLYRIPVDLKSHKEEFLARFAVYLEQDLLRETVGFQDQIISSIGGLRQINISKINNTYSWTTTELPYYDWLNKYILLFYTGQSRIASHVAKQYVGSNIKQANEEMYAIALEGIQALKSQNIQHFSYAINESWYLKRDLSPNISNQMIDDTIEFGLKNGAYCGRIMGAGNGGMILFLAPPKYHEKIIKNIPLLHIPAQIISDNPKGTRIILNE